MGVGAGSRPAEAELEVLLFFVNRVRDAVVRASAGLTAEQHRVPGVPSGTSLLGLIRHLTAVGQHWFQRVFLGEDVSIDICMDVPGGATSDEVVAACPRLSTMARIANMARRRPSRCRSWYT
jgi:Protein of unknown function (DUF664)